MWRGEREKEGCERKRKRTMRGGVREEERYEWRRQVNVGKMSQLVELKKI